MIYFKFDRHYLFADEEKISCEKILATLLKIKDYAGKEPAIKKITEERALSEADMLHFLFEGEPHCSKCAFALTDVRMLENAEEGFWHLRKTKEAVSNLNPKLTSFLDDRKIRAVNLSYPRFHLYFGKEPCIGVSESGSSGKRVNILALGDVGGTLLLGLKLLGGPIISSIGIHDISPDMMQRMEFEMNQINDPDDVSAMPSVQMIREDQLFDADMFIFCASKGVPPVGTAAKDVRMVQFEANQKIIAHYAGLASQNNFKGIFAVVSDPVDQLCRAALLAGRSENENGMENGSGAENRSGAENGCGMRPEQIKGYGLGVMNSRGMYYARQDERFTSFITRGRCFGPHGNGLYLVNDIENYDPYLSDELTKLALTANLKVRETGFKPYLAPAIASGSIPIILTLSGKWHYSANFLHGVYMGARNRITPAGLELEQIFMPDALYDKLQGTYESLKTQI